MAEWHNPDLSFRQRILALITDLQSRGWRLRLRRGSRSWANPLTRTVALAVPEVVDLDRFLFSFRGLTLLVHEHQHVQDWGEGRLRQLWRGLCYLVSPKYRARMEVRAIIAWAEVADPGLVLLQQKLARLVGCRGPYWTALAKGAVLRIYQEEQVLTPK